MTMCVPSGWRSHVILVDSTVWIDLRTRSTRASVRLRQFLGLREAAVSPVIVQEILQGATGAATMGAGLTVYRKIAARFSNMI